MKSHCFDWRTRSLRAALMAAFLLSASLAQGQVAVPAKTEDENPPLPSKKTGDEDPPLPSKKPGPAKEVRVQVTAASAEVQAGDKVVATVSRGEVLPFSKKTDDYYLVTVNGKKGWIKREAVREIEVSVGGPDAPTVEVPPGPAPAVIDKDTAHKVKKATAYLRVRLASGKTVEGSGFFAVQPGLVFTNAHVLGMRRPGSPMPEEVRVVVHSGEPEEFTLSAQVLCVDRENDLGVLRVKGRADRLPAPLPVDTSRALDLTQKVYVFGFPFGTSLGKDITASESSVSAIRKNDAGIVTEVQVNGGMHPGNSGGPVVDTRGVVVGVAVAVINGTQINKAIPGERVQELLRGRVAQTQFGEAFLDDEDEATLPVRLSCLDPLQRIRTVKLEVWTGKAGPARPPSPTEPKSLPGDGPRRSLAVTYKDSGAHIDVAIPSLAADQVLWVQPVLTDTGGTTHWAGAVVYKPSILSPLVREAAVLQQNFERQTQRTIRLTGTYKVQVSRGRKQTLYRDSMEVEALETAQKEPRGGRLDLFLGAYKFTTTLMDGKAQPMAPKAQALLRDRSMTFLVDPQGALQQRTVPVLHPPHPEDLREDFADLVHQIANAYEMTCLAVPNRRVEAQETWQARVPVLLSYEGKKNIFDMFLTCTYEGSRDNGEQKYAVIRLSGYIKGRKPGQQSTLGTVTAKMHFALDDGYLSLAHIEVDSEGEDDDIAVAHSLEVTMTRGRGNKTGIVARPVAPSPQPATNPDYELAIPHLQKRDFDQALPLLEKAVAANPNLVPALADLGFAYNEKRLFDKAIPCFKKVIELEPKHVNAHNNLGAAYNGMGLYDDAIPCFKKAIELDPDHATAHSNLGFAYKGKKLYDQAIPCFEKMVELDPQNVIAHSNLGVTYNEKRLHDKAIACFKRVLELDPKNVAGHNYLGFTYNAKGLYDDAISCLKKALELDPKHASALNNLGFAYNALGLYDQGIQLLKKAIELHPKHDIAYNNLGKALEEVGDLEQAREVLKKGLALTPEKAPQFQSRKQTLEQMEALVGLAASLADIAKGEKKPKDFQEGLQFGKICRVKQHYKAAIRLYEQAFTSDPDAAKKIAPINFVILARAALLASAGQGSDPPTEADRPEYRAKALAWLQDFVKSQQKVLEKDFNANRYSCQINLRVLLRHKDLASVRPPALNNLPEGERKKWENFWNEVETLLEKADALTPDPSAKENP
jgi:tetratricopeptide (TPR) repeat protein/S1-C subfamily serine protease